MQDRQLMVYHFMTSWLHDFMFGAGWERDASHAPSGHDFSLQAAWAGLSL